MDCSFCTEWKIVLQADAAFDLGWMYTVVMKSCGKKGRSETDKSSISGVQMRSLIVMELQYVLLMYTHTPPQVRVVVAMGVCRAVQRLIWIVMCSEHLPYVPLWDHRDVEFCVLKWILRKAFSPNCCQTFILVFQSVSEFFFVLSGISPFCAVFSCEQTACSHPRGLIQSSPPDYYLRLTVGGAMIWITQLNLPNTFCFWSQSQPSFVQRLEGVSNVSVVRS